MIERGLTANEQLVNDAIRHAVHLERLKTGERNRAIALLNDDVFPDIRSTVAERLDKISVRGFDKSVHTTKRLKGMMNRVQNIIDTKFDKMGVSFDSRLVDIGQSESIWQAAQLKSATGFGISFETPSITLIRAIIRERPFQGLLQREWYTGIKRNLRAAVQKEINIGLVNGETTDQIVRRIHGTRAAGYKDGVFNGTRRQVESLVRTSVNHMTSQARELVYEENTDVVKGVQIVATLDARTTEICAALDGTVYNVGEGERPPFHWGCRTTTVPVLKSWKEMGINLKEPLPGTRASKVPTFKEQKALKVKLSGQVPERITYPQWLKKQPKDIQEEVLGKGKAALFRRGKVKIDRFVDNKNRPLTLKELERLEKHARMN